MAGAGRCLHTTQVTSSTLMIRGWFGESQRIGFDDPLGAGFRTLNGSTLLFINGGRREPWRTSILLGGYKVPPRAHFVEGPQKMMGYLVLV